MIGIAAYFYYCTTEFVADATEISVQFRLYGRVYQRLSIFGAEYDVDVVFYE